MPVLPFLAAAGLALLALLFVADSMLEDSSSPIVTSSRVGLPVTVESSDDRSPHHHAMPAPDMTSPAQKTPPEVDLRRSSRRSRARRVPKCHPRIMPKYQPRIFKSRRRLTIARTAGATDCQSAVNSAAMEHWSSPACVRVGSMADIPITFRPHKSLPRGGFDLGQGT